MKISVVVPTYNHANFIESCIKGVLNQKVKFDLELLIGDDESSDGTTELIEEYLKLDSRIKLLKGSRKNVIYIDGEATGRSNWVNLLKNAEGKYIALCDGDDYWIDEYKLQKQVDFLEANEGYSICFTNNLIKEGGKLKPNNIILPNKDVFTVEDLVKGNFMNTPTVVFRNDFNYDKLPKWFFEVKIGDWSLYSIILRGRKIKYLEDITAVYRIHNGGVFSIREKSYKFIQYYNMLSAINKHFDYKYNNIIKECKENVIDVLQNGLNLLYDVSEDGVLTKSKILNQLNREESILFEYINNSIKGNVIYVWGAGTHTKNLFKLLKSRAFDMNKIVLIIDSDINKKSSIFEGKNVIYSEDFLQGKSKKCTDIIISSASYEEEIYDKIENYCTCKKINIIKLYNRGEKIKVLI